MQNISSKSLVVFLGVLTACGPGCYQTEQFVDAEAVKTEEQGKLALGLAERLSQTQYGLQQHLSPANWQELLASCQSATPPAVRFPHRESTGELPEVADVTLDLQIPSRYDEAPCHAFVRAPQDSKAAKAVVLRLGIDRELESSPGLWQIAIPPSRPALGYRFISEGDLWNAWETCVRAYPRLRTLPVIVVGNDSYADAALQLAEQYRYRFAGVVVNGNLKRTNYKNLDQFPVASLTGTAHDSLWDGSHIIQSLQERGNPFAFQAEGDLDACIDQILALQEQVPLVPPTQIKDYQYAQVTPWLRIESKEHEATECGISAELGDKGIILDTRNIRALTVDCSHPSFPSSMRYVTWQGETHPIPSEGALELGNRPKDPRYLGKSAVPGTLQNFYRNEPLLVVYDDSVKSESYEDTAKKLADRFAHLDFVGLPASSTNLPTVPLSLYRPARFPKHRAIFIGQRESFSSFVKLPRSEALSLAIHDAGAENLKLNADTVSLSACCPPHRPGNLQLAYLIASPTTEALQQLSSSFSLATCLLTDEDVSIWAPLPSGLGLLTSRHLDSHWAWQERPLPGVPVAEQSAQTWDSYLRELLVQATQQQEIALPLLVDATELSPRQINAQELRRILPERRFCLVTLKGSRCADVANKLLTGLSLEQVSGLSDIVREDGFGVRVDSKALRKQVRRLLVDSRRLNQLTESELQLIEYEPVSQTLHEIVLKELERDPRAFARGLMRTAQQAQL
ncbi:MAG: hypothetical protein KDK78_00355 [Chlamydiia bacterium]|nr:hypothetical protein [Chlamydiia bacterium]